MKRRREFLASCASAALAGALVPALARPAEAKASATSGLGRAWAEVARSFDPALSKRELDSIAKGVEDNRRAAARLSRGKNRLQNWDEPVTRFSVRERE